MTPDSSGNDRNARKHEQAGGPGMPRNKVSHFLISALATAKDEQCGGSESEENKVGRRHVAENLLIAPGKRDHAGQNALERDGNHRRPSARRNIAHASEEEAVLRHRKVDTWRGQHSLA